jgi:hypothetical protein
VETTRTVSAFVAKRTGGTDITGLEQPHARKRQFLVDEPLDKSLEERIERPFLGECK